MGALTNQFEGISRDLYEKWLAKVKGDANAEKCVRCWSTDLDGRYHDPETQAFWEREIARQAPIIDAAPAVLKSRFCRT